MIKYDLTGGHSNWSGFIWISENCRNPLSHAHHLTNSWKAIYVVNGCPGLGLAKNHHPHALVIMDESLSWWVHSLQKVVCCLNWLRGSSFSGPLELEIVNMKHLKCTRNCRLFKIIGLNCSTFMLTWTLRGYIYLLTVYSKRGQSISDLWECQIVFFHFAVCVIPL